jgi:hypothetical protein
MVLMFAASSEKKVMFQFFLFQQRVTQLIELMGCGLAPMII